MKCVNNRGFSATEALVGFLLMSVMLMLYIPGFQSEVLRLSRLQAEMHQWHVFYDLVNLKLAKDSQGETLRNRIALYNVQYDAITEFDCDESQCWISFENGATHHVLLEAIE
ncbi:hypothetical protein IU402_05505 [Aerococcaceae bacterium zg-BR9]|uniref:pilus assembly FimT family protein n=1 Tax=Aerococcaceae bacterium zg-1292 TaxID=2774330 RepID=UPI0040646D38|nr:hypothetical protein [Aerococcaceae bacterium zg-BR9]